MTFFYSCCRVFSVLPLLVFIGQANSADIYAYVDTQGKLLISEKKNDARYVRFEPPRNAASGRTSSNIFSNISSHILFHATPQTTSWRAKQLALRLGPQALAKQQTIVNLPIHNKALHYTPLISNIAEEVGVSANLLHAIIQIESAYNPEATSLKGAQGLMQLIPATAQRFGVEQSYDPAANVRGGARYIKNLLMRFDNNLQLALAAYNAGEGAVHKYNNTIPPYPETQVYVNRVLSLLTQREE